MQKLSQKGQKRTCETAAFTLFLHEKQKNSSQCCNFQDYFLSMSRQLRKTGNIEERNRRKNLQTKDVKKAYTLCAYIGKKWKMPKIHKRVGN